MRCSPRVICTLLHTFNDYVRAQFMTRRAEENSNVKDVNSRDVWNKVSGRMVITIPFVSQGDSKNQRLVDAKVDLIYNSSGIKRYFRIVDYRRKINKSIEIKFQLDLSYSILIIVIFFKCY